MDLTPKLLSVSEAAAYLNLSPFTIRAWVSQKKIPYHKVGRRVLLHQSDLDTLIEASRVPAWTPRKEGAK